MALSAEDREELKSVYAEGLAAGLNLFRSQEEERIAKLNAENPPKEEKPTKPKEESSGGFDLAGFVLGR